MRHPRQLHVADIEPAPLHQPIEVRPRHRLADIGVRPVEHRETRRDLPASRHGCAPHARSRGGLDRVDDGLIAGAAAVIAGKMFADLLAVRRRRFASADPAPPSAFPACRSRIAARCDRGTRPADRRSRRCRTALRWSRRTRCASAPPASGRNERSRRSTRTVQAPQTPCSQPTCVPVSFRCSRRKSARLSRGRTCASTRSPLTSSEMGMGAVTPSSGIEIGPAKQRGHATRQQHFCQMPAHGRRSPADRPADRVRRPAPPRHPTTCRRDRRR